MPRLSKNARARIDAIYRSHGAMVMRRVRNFFGPEEAEEVFQDVFMVLLEKLDSYRAEASLTSWLYRLTTNHCLNRIRDRGRRRALLDQHGPELQRGTRGPSQESVVFLRELWRELPEELLQIGVYHHVDGMTHAAISELLGVSRRTVGNRLIELSRLARGED